MNLDYDPHDLAAQEAAKTAAARKEQTKRARLVSDVKWLMSGPRGRRFLRHLLDSSGALSGELYKASATDTARAIGRLEFGRETLDLILEHAATDFLLLRKEAADDDADQRDGRDAS